MNTFDQALFDWIKDYFYGEVADETVRKDVTAFRAFCAERGYDVRAYCTTPKVQE